MKRIKPRVGTLLFFLILFVLTGCRSNSVNNCSIPPLSSGSTLTEIEPENVPLTPKPPASAGKKQESSVLSIADSEAKFIAFTFDDGPGDYTSELLDGLAERNAKATFFIATCRVTKPNSALVKRMDDENHTVASHTVNHSKLHLLPTDQIKEEIRGADETLRQITGKTPALLRPPYGNFSTRVLNAIGKPAIVWSIDTKDWRDHDAKIIRDAIVNNASDGDIVLLHEWEKSSKDGALLAMDALAEEGYRFVTVPELFQIKGISLEAGQYYAAANGKDFDERLVFDKDDKYPHE